MHPINTRGASSAVNAAIFSSSDIAVVEPIGESNRLAKDLRVAADILRGLYINALRALFGNASNRAVSAGSSRAARASHSASLVDVSLGMIVDDSSLVFRLISHLLFSSGPAAPWLPSSRRRRYQHRRERDRLIALHIPSCRGSYSLAHADFRSDLNWLSDTRPVGRAAMISRSPPRASTIRRSVLIRISS